MAFLVLEDGTVFEGIAFGEKKDIIGEVVFNTGMTGYQEVLTDPSYCGQLVVMTYPLIGNYGINSEDTESEKPQVNAYIVRELCDMPNNWRKEITLAEYMEQSGIVGLQGIDTRALTKRLRKNGSMRGIISQDKPTEEQIAEMKKYKVDMPVDKVTCKKQYTLGSGKYKVAVLDFGSKMNILRSLVAHDCTLTVFPARTAADDILSGGFDGVMLTNGPGDPQDNKEVIANIKKLAGKIPIFGICLGHQMLALAMGADTHPLKYGHRGTNHPVKDLKMDRVFITSQNHGYTIVPDSLPENVVISHISLNDGTIEGLRYTVIPAFSVQFHPEAAPGPKDTAYLFDEFVHMMEVK